MKNPKINSSIAQIGEMTFDKLKTLNVPLYPKYYSDTFVDFLNTQNDSELLEFYKKNPNLFCVETDIGHLTNEGIGIARDGIEQFNISNENLRTLSDEQGVELANLTSEFENKHAQELYNLLLKFQLNIAKQMKDSDNHIAKLRSNIEELENSVNINSLTKMFNIVEFEKDLKALISLGKNKDIDAFLVIINADNFANINKQFGRVAGDKTIIYLSGLLKSSLRSGTKVYHTNGDEFSIILNRADLDQTENTVDRIIKETAKSKLFYKGNNINLTISAGVGSYRKDDDYKKIVNRAKKALQNAKQNGKNCFKEEL